MQWMLESLAEVLLKVLNDLLGWSSALISDFALDIGYNSGKTVLESRNIVADATRDVINQNAMTNSWDFVVPWKVAKTGLFDELLPGASNFGYAFLALGLLFVLIITIYKLYQALLGPFTEAEPPLEIAGRGILAGAGVAWSYSIFVALEIVFNRAYTYFQGVFTSSTSSALEQYNEFIAGQTHIVNQVDTFSGIELDPTTYTESFWGSAGFIKETTLHNGVSGGLALSLLEVIIGIAIIYSLIRLVLEFYQRYVTIGFLYYTCPLAFSMLSSRGTKRIFGNWTQMILAQFVLMMMNLFFLGVFFASFYTLIVNRAKTGNIFATDKDFVATMFIWLAWLITGQKADEHLRSLGLSIAQTGAGLGAAILGGAMAARTALSIAAAPVALGGRALGGTARGISRVADGLEGNDTSLTARAVHALRDGVETAGRQALADKFDNAESGTLASANDMAALKSAAGENGVSMGRLSEDGQRLSQESFDFDSAQGEFIDMGGGQNMLHMTDANGLEAYTSLAPITASGGGEVPQIQSGDTYTAVGMSTANAANSAAATQLNSAYALKGIDASARYVPGGGELGTSSYREPYIEITHPPRGEDGVRSVTYAKVSAGQYQSFANGNELRTSALVSAASKRDLPEYTLLGK